MGLRLILNGPADTADLAADNVSRLDRPGRTAMVTVRRTSLAKAVALGCLFALLARSHAEAGSFSLGTAGQFNVYVSGNMTEGSGTLGTSLAVGGNLTMSHFTIGGSSSSGYGMVVGGTLNSNQGKVLSGNAQVAGAVTMATNDNAALATGETLYYGSQAGNTFPTFPHFGLTHEANGGIASNFFSSANTTLTTDSSLLAAQQADGTVTVVGGTMTLTGTNSNTVYFNVSGSVLNNIHSLVINAPASATVIINVNGTTDQLTSMGMMLHGPSGSNILFNFDQATSLTLSDVNFDASILAPYATLYATSSNTQGNVMVAAISASNGGIAYQDSALFTGNPLIPSVPEPSSIVLGGIGALGLCGLLAWRRRLEHE